MKTQFAFVLSFLFLVGGLFAQVKPSRPKVGELPIGKIITWRADDLSKKFFIQRSEDGVSFRTIGKVMVEDTTRRSFYTYLDVSLSPDEVYYRIAQVSHGSGIQYSDIAFYCSSAPNELVLKRISDSEVDKVVIVEFESAKRSEGDYKITTEIENHTFTVYERPVSILKGNNILPIKVDFLDPGFYQVYLMMGNEVEKFSFVRKQRKPSDGVIVAKH